jgi:hypothetical protein
MFCLENGEGAVHTSLGNAQVHVPTTKQGL